jgi:hypothetical protein
MHTQSRERSFERFAADIVEIHINAVRRFHVQLFEHRAGLVIEGDVKAAFLAQKFYLLHGTGGADDFASA